MMDLYRFLSPSTNRGGWWLERPCEHCNNGPLNFINVVEGGGSRFDKYLFVCLECEEMTKIRQDDMEGMELPFRVVIEI